MNRIFTQRDLDRLGSIVDEVAAARLLHASGPDPLRAALLTLPLPHPSLAPNGRPGHWANKSPHAAQYRQDGHCVAIDWMNRHARVWEPWNTALVLATFYHLTNRRRDEDGLSASLKSALDGIADARFIQNDAGFSCLPPEQVVVKENHRVELRIVRTS